MKRIAITGPGGAGKTTLALQLQRILNVEIFHMDLMFWKESWIPTTEAERKKRLENSIQKQEWIIEGDGDGSSIKLIYDMRFAAADTIVWLDLPPSLCLWQLVKRLYENKDRDRFDLPPRCREDWRSDGFHQCLKRVWNYRTDSHPLVRQKINEHCGVKRVFILRSRVEVQDFVEAIARVNALSASPTRKPLKEISARQKLMASVATS